MDRLKYMPHISIIKNDESREVYKQQNEIIDKVGVDNLYCELCKKTGKTIINPNKVKNYFEYNGVQLMRRPKGMVFYPSMVKGVSKDDIYKNEIIKRFSNYTGIEDEIIAVHILREFDHDYEEAIKFLYQEI